MEKQVQAFYRIDFMDFQFLQSLEQRKVHYQQIKSDKNQSIVDKGFAFCSSVQDDEPFDDNLKKHVKLYQSIEVLLLN